MPETLRYEGTLVTVTCWCGIHHAVPESLRNEQQRQHDDGKQVRSIYCPLGHTHVPVGESEVERVRRERDRARDYRARETARAEQAEAKARAHKGHATRLRKRAKAGVCPACNRSFKQLREHM